MREEFDKSKNMRNCRNILCQRFEVRKEVYYYYYYYYYYYNEPRVPTTLGK